MVSLNKFNIVLQHWKCFRHTNKGFCTKQTLLRHHVGIQRLHDFGVISLTSKKKIFIFPIILNYCSVYTIYKAYSLTSKQEQWYVAIVSILALTFHYCRNQNLHNIEDMTVAVSLFGKYLLTVFHYIMKL